MKLIGLTGGIGCGKTTVVHEFERIGTPCFVADSHAATYYEDPLFLEEVRRIFGDSVFRSDGSADKRAIASIVFNDESRMEELNRLVHPRVMHDFAIWAESHDAATPYVIIESAILYEYNLDRKLDAVIAIYLDREERISRLAVRDNASREQIEERMRNQLAAEEKMDRADYVILNYEGNPRQRQVAYIDSLIRSL
jgi:dephospho-CoA kinase